ncbi:MAG: helix-turn-helix transcriptional regulator [Firmicutes bacterium]|nr:helix-turn-helix transcriptional regulator [Bacillota bacterium]
MLKEHLKKQGKSMYALSKESGVAYSTLNDIANGKVDPDNCKLGIFRTIANALNLSLDELYDLCVENNESVTTDYGIPVNISVRQKSFYIFFNYNEEPVEIELCKVNGDTRRYLSYIAKWRAEEYIRERRMNDPWNIF